ncbi:DC-STAMP domain-containing protein 2 [Drosophila grimshawi]|uniref:DC-STAMP domain-containing protein 2 n=1 Tax=Drosophila grimshawi TaxID=7222 RepID=UPI001C936002|nr:DC-STAMP domain-containing protein 2 [Drosophila grimshawi]
MENEIYQLKPQKPIDPKMDAKVRSYYYGKRRSQRMRRVKIKSRIDEGPATIYPEESESPAAGSRMDVKLTAVDKLFICDYLMIYLILGYILGIFLVLLWYLFNKLLFHKASSDLSLYWLLIVLLVLLLLIVLYNRTTRSIGALWVPLVAGCRGQVLIIAIAFVLAVAGPMMNIIRNVEIMVYTLSCGQTLLRNALTPMHEIMGQPVYAIEDAVYYCLSQVRRIMQRLDVALRHLETPILRMHAGYQSCDAWLQHQQSWFDTQMGSPYDRCLGAGTLSIQECEYKFKDQRKAICNISNRFEWFCANLKALPSFFDTHLKEQQAVVDHIFKTPMQSTAQIRGLFEVSITFDHNTSSSDDRHHLSNELELEMDKELQLHMKHLQFTFIWLEFVILLLIVLIILRSIYYRWSYLGSANFNNVYLTSQFTKFNNRMQLKYGNNDLPMIALKAKKYGFLGSCRILPSELSYMFRSVMFLIIASLQLFTICFVDHCLYSMLAMMAYQSHQTAELQPPVYTKLIIKNGGFISGVLRNLTTAFEPLTKNLIVDIQRCFPLPSFPNYFHYFHIIVLCMLAWLLVLLEPFSIRLRHRMLDAMYQRNAEQRAAFLFRHLQIRKDSFIKPARRRARSQNIYAYENRISKVLTQCSSCLYRLSYGCLGAYRGKYCTICNMSLTKDDCVACDTKGCRGVYCQSCFLESNCQCVLCNPRVRYGDSSDISDVGDSSDEPQSQPFREDGNYCSAKKHEGKQY